MQGNRGRDTRPELALRRRLHALGLRYRVNAQLPLHGVRRRADVAFPRLRVAVFVDGCLWHSCPDHCRPPRTNAEYWRDKLARNHARDMDTDRRLTELGWIVLRIWEHEDPPEAAAKVATLVASRRPKATAPACSAVPRAVPRHESVGDRLGVASGIGGNVVLSPHSCPQGEWCPGPSASQSGTGTPRPALDRDLASTGRPHLLRPAANPNQQPGRPVSVREYLRARQSPTPTGQRIVRGD